MIDLVFAVVVVVVAAAAVALIVVVSAHLYLVVQVPVVLFHHVAKCILGYLVR